MKTILILGTIFLCAHFCSGRYFSEHFFRYKPRMPFIKTELSDEDCKDDPDYAEGEGGCRDMAANEDYCKDQEDFMRKHCAKTCGFCGEGTAKPPAPAVCEDDPDYADGCPDHADVEQYCKDQEDFMREHCAKSCGFCHEGIAKPPAPTVCEDDPDYADGCPDHAEVEQYCKDQEDFMRKHCAKSCGYCTEEP